MASSGGMSYDEAVDFATTITLSEMGDYFLGKERCALFDCDSEGALDHV